MEKEGEGVAGYVQFITSHEQAQLNRIGCFHFFSAFISSKGSNLYCSGVSNVPCGGCKTPLNLHHCADYIISGPLGSLINLSSFCISRCYRVWPVLHISLLVMNRFKYSNLSLFSFL